MLRNQNRCFITVNEIVYIKLYTLGHFTFKCPVSFALGEHIDYCGYAVLPMAVEQDIFIGVSPNDEGLLRLENTDTNYRYYIHIIVHLDFVCLELYITLDTDLNIWVLKVGF